MKAVILYPEAFKKSVKKQSTLFTKKMKISDKACSVCVLLGCTDNTQK